MNIQAPNCTVPYGIRLTDEHMMKGLTVWVRVNDTWRPATLDIEGLLGDGAWWFRFTDTGERQSALPNQMYRRNPHRHGHDKPAEDA